MFSGKTEELIRRLRLAVHAKRKVQAFKPRIDDRYDSDKVVTHYGAGLDALAVPNSVAMEAQIAPDTRVVGIDEAQFFDAGIVDLVEKLADSGVCVLLAGLDQDYLGRPFAPMPQLMAIAEHVTKVYAVCATCGAPATRSQRIVDQSATILVGGEESYEPRCRACFQRREISRSSLSHPTNTCRNLDRSHRVQ
ncbi:MAG: thymidine kinase [Sorangium cellulosum]|nr:MAG: thymidine kinase [Sorangium cellulosum]